MSNLYIYGAGGHGRVIADFFFPTEHIISFVDDAHKPGTIGPEQVPNNSYVIVAIGDNRRRRQVVQKLKSEGKDFSFPSVKHFSAVASNLSFIGEGAALCAKSVVIVGAKIGAFCIINTSASVDHDCIVGDFSHVAPGVHLCGNVEVGAGTLIGVGTSVRPGIKIGENSIIGAGSVVVEDIPSYVMAYGNPCKVVSRFK